MCFLCILNFFLKFNVFICVILMYIIIDINDRDLGDFNISTSNYVLHCIFLLCFDLLCVVFVLVLSIWYYLILSVFPLQSNSGVCALNQSRDSFKINGFY